MAASSSVAQAEGRVVESKMDVGVAGGAASGGVVVGGAGRAGVVAQRAQPAKGRAANRTVEERAARRRCKALKRRREKSGKKSVGPAAVRVLVGPVALPLLPAVPAPVSAAVPALAAPAIPAALPAPVPMPATAADVVAIVVNATSALFARMLPLMAASGSGLAGLLGPGGGLGLASAPAGLASAPAGGEPPPPAYKGEDKRIGPGGGREKGKGKRNKAERKGKSSKPKGKGKRSKAKRSKHSEPGGVAAAGGRAKGRGGCVGTVGMVVGSCHHKAHPKCEVERCGWCCLGDCEASHRGAHASKSLKDSFKEEQASQVTLLG